MKRVVLLLILIAACKRPEQPAAPAIDTTRPKQLVEQYGCLSCHEIPGLGGVKGMGPSLAGIGARPTITPKAVPNNPANVAKYIENPQEVDPDATMPNLGVPAADATVLAAYLATLK